MEKKLLINFDNLLQVEQFAEMANSLTDIEYMNCDDIKTLKDKINDSKYSKILFYFDTKNVNFSSLLSIISASKSQNEQIAVVINASDFSEEDNELLDEVIDIITDYLFTIINDNIDDLIRYLSEYLK